MAVLPAPVLAFDRLDSTNAEARRRAEAGEAGPVWITAAEQTAGKGRRGRSWATGAGNLAATLLTTTERPATEASQLAFVAALAVADVVRAHIPPESVRLKWPNDVLVNGLKVSGILIESGPAGEGRLWLAVGVGLNLASAPEGTERPAAALADFLTRPPPAPREALDALAAAFARRQGAWEDGGFEPIRQAWTQQAHGLGGPCIVRLERETVEGVAEGLDPSGALRLRLPSGELRPITAGDVFFSGGA